jgi:hypothetical protein
MSVITKLAAAKDIMSGVTFSASGGVDRSKMPAVPPVTEDLPVYTGDADLLALCMWQIRKSNDRSVIVRALASAAAAILFDKNNFTGSPTKSVPLAGFNDLSAAGVDLTKTAVNNFADGEPVTGAEWVLTASFDETEVAAYYGVLCIAMCSQPIAGAPLNKFNKNRAAAATKAVIGSPKIFIAESPWLSFEVLQKVHASFNMYGPSRCHLITNVLRHRGEFRIGLQENFMDMFFLLTDFGLTNLSIIRDAILRYPWIVTDFEGLESEVKAANDAFLKLSEIDAETRPFAKAMFQNHLVFTAPANIRNLLGICRYALSHTHATYAQYRGGFTTPKQEAYVLTKLDVAAKPAPVVAVTPAP